MTRRSSLILIAAVAAILLACSTRPAIAQAGVWSMKAHLPEPRGEVAAVVLNGQLYAMGGAALGQESSTLAEAYDPATDKWRVLAPIPRAVSHPGVTALNGKIYVVGGFTANVHANAQDAVFEYDPAKNTWKAVASLGKPRGSVGTVAIDGRIHAIGGRGLDKVTVTTHEVYDPATNRWTTAALLPVARDHLTAIAYGGRIHVIGGRTNNNTTDNTAFHDVYDPRANIWSKAAPMPTARSAIAATVYKDLIVVAGGECDNGHTFTQHEAYDPKTDRWRTLTSIVGRHGFGAGTIGGAAYFVGGNKGCGGGDTTDELLAFQLP